MQKYEKQTEREGTGSHVDCSCARDSEIISMETRFSQAQVLRLCPLSPWQVTLSLRMFFFFCFVFPEVHRSVSALLTHSAWEEQRNLHPFFFFFFSQRYQVLLKCGRLRTLTGSHLAAWSLWRVGCSPERNVRSHHSYNRTRSRSSY